MAEKIKEIKKATSIMLTPTDKAYLQAICEADERSVSFVLGRLVREEFKRRNLELPPKPATY